MEQQSAVHVCDQTLQNVLQQFVLPGLPPAVLGNLRAACTLLRTWVDEDSRCWASAASGDDRFQAKVSSRGNLKSILHTRPSDDMLQEVLCPAETSDRRTCIFRPTRLIPSSTQKPV